LGIQVFLTDKVVGKLGIARSIFILPLALIAGVGILIIFPVITFAVVIKLFDGSLKQTIHKASSELILLPLPQYLKLKTKTFLDVTIDSLATGISGIMIFLLVDTLNLPNVAVLILLFIILLLWLVYANKVKKEYIKSFRLSLHLKEENLKNRQTIIDTYRSVLDKGDQAQILKILNKMTFLQVTQLSNSILNLINHPESRIVTKAIERLNELKKDFGSDIIKLTEHPKATIRLAALRYLMVHNKSLDVNYFIDKINAKDYVERTTSLLALVIEYKNQPETMQLLQVRKRIDEIINHINLPANVALKKEILPTVFRIIAYAKLVNDYPLIESYIDKEEPYQSQAMLSLGIINEPNYIDRILQIMEKDEDSVIAGTRALTEFGFEKISTYTLDLLHKNEIKKLHFLPDVLIHFPVMYSIKTLVKLSETTDKNLTRKAIAAINEIINDDPLVPVDKSKINKIIIKEIEYFQQLVKNFESISHLIKDTKEKEYFFEKIKAFYQSTIDNQLETVFVLLNIKYPPEELNNLYPLFKGQDDETRSNAIEYLENLLTPNIKAYLIPILENQMVFSELPTNNIEFDEKEFQSSLAKIENKELRARLIKFFENEIQNHI
jgi:AAA family ATP:ADP antiporter